MSEFYIDARGFLHYLTGNINIKLSVRVVGQSLEFKVKDPSDAGRLGRDVVLVPLSDLAKLVDVDS